MCRICGGQWTQHEYEEQSLKYHVFNITNNLTLTLVFLFVDWLIFILIGVVLFNLLKRSWLSKGFCFSTKTKAAICPGFSRMTDLKYFALSDHLSKHTQFKFKKILLLEPHSIPLTTLFFSK